MAKKHKAKKKPRPLKPVKRKVQTKAAVAAKDPTLEAAKSPFHTGDEMQDLNAQQGDWREELGSLNNDYLAQNAALPQALEQIAKGAAAQKEGANSDAIARGVFASSIRDTAVADVEAQRATQTTNATSLVSAASQAYNTRKNQIEGAGGERAQYMGAYNHQAVDNAEAANENRQVIDPGTPGSAAQYKQVQDFAPGTPGIQSKGQAMKIRKRRANKPGSSKPAGAGRGNLKGRPNRPGKPRHSTGHGAF